MIPQTETTWVAAISSLELEPDRRLDLINTRPIVAWFSNKKKTIHRLVKVTTRLGDDLWIMPNVTMGPTTLDKALRYLTLENGWFVCEFKEEMEFYKAALAYLQDE